MIEYNHFIKDDGSILFLDFKAFDIEHSFISQTLKYFGFGQKCINIINMLY